jgi:hypothetical protein
MQFDGIHQAAREIRVRWGPREMAKKCAVCALIRFHFRRLQSDRTQRGFFSKTAVPGKQACWGGRKAAPRYPVLFRVEVKMLSFRSSCVSSGSAG